jgi:hypothetical protein
MTTEEMLEQRHTLKLLWVEPWKACGPEGNELYAHLELRATVHDCVNMSRAAAKQAGRPTMGEDERHLLDFMAVHWATPDLSNVRDEPRAKRVGSGPWLGASGSSTTQGAEPTQQANDHP